MSFTVIKKDLVGLEENMLDNLPFIPKVGFIKAHGLNEVEFPIFSSDPSEYLPEDLETVSLKELKERLRPYAVDYSSDQTDTIDFYKIEDIVNLPPSSQAKSIAAMISNHKKRPAMPAVVNRLIKDAITNHNQGLSEDSHLMSLVGYLGHYLGDENSHLLRKVAKSGEDINPDLEKSVVSELSNVKGVIKKGNEAIKNISVALGESDATLPEKIESVAEAAIALGADSNETHILAHHSSFRSNVHQPEAPQNHESPRLRM